MNGKDHLLGRRIHSWQGGIGVGHSIGLSLSQIKNSPQKAKTCEDLYKSWLEIHVCQRTWKTNMTRTKCALEAI